MKEPTEFNAIKHVVKACADCPFFQYASNEVQDYGCNIDQELVFTHDTDKKVAPQCPLKENDQVITYDGPDSKRCGYVWVPGLLNPPGNTKPTTKVRCSLLHGHEGECQYVRLP